MSANIAMMTLFLLDHGYDREQLEAMDNESILDAYAREKLPDLTEVDSPEYRAEHGTDGLPMSPSAID